MFIRRLLQAVRPVAANDDRHSRFDRICEANDLSLSYEANKDELGILSDIFEDREYADYFPFRRTVTVVDVGAHYGYFSLFAHKNTGSASRIFAIEPGAGNFTRLTGNVGDCKAANVVPIKCAVGPTNQLSQLRTGRSANNSLVSDYSLLASETSTEMVETKTLDRIMLEHHLENVDFLKLDCEGSEYAILGAMSRQTFDRISIISMEFHDMKSDLMTGDSLIEVLIANGFQIAKYHYDRTTMGLNYGKIIARKTAPGVSRGTGSGATS